MSIVIQPDGQVKQGGRKIAQLRNEGTLLDVRRHENGFLYSRGFSVALAEELLEALPDPTVIQITDLDRGDVYTTTCRDFRHHSTPVQFGGYEFQRSMEIRLMNHTLEGSPKQKRVNELQHVDTTPVPEYRQPSLFG
jgi:hypothetical protein